MLAEWPAKGGEKEKVVILSAKGEVGGKLISVVEIVKRELAGQGAKWFQYTIVEGKKEERKKKKMRKQDDSGEEKRQENGKESVGDAEEEEDDGEEEAFEVMKTPFERAIEGQPKIREVPAMVIYLSRVRLDGLRKKYGYAHLFLQYCNRFRNKFTDIPVENRQTLSQRGRNIRSRLWRRNLICVPS